MGLLNAWQGAPAPVNGWVYWGQGVLGSGISVLVLDRRRRPRVLPLEWRDGVLLPLPSSPSLIPETRQLQYRPHRSGIRQPVASGLPLMALRPTAAR